MGVFPSDSTYDERSSELQRLQNIYARLVFVCEEIEAGIEVIKRGSYTQTKHRHVSNTHPADPANMLQVSTNGYLSNITYERDYSRIKETIPHARTSQSSSESSPEKDGPLRSTGYSPRLTGSHASFAEAHRVIVMDAVRTDMTPIHNLLLTSSSGGALASLHPYIVASDSSFANASVFPVSGCGGLPELMLVDPPELHPSQAIATGEQPIWKSNLAAQMIDGSEHLSILDKKIILRLVNILSAYAVHDPENGYCQGMSDLAIVFVGIEQDDALAFACFEKFMRAARQNFRHDEAGIKNQLKEISEIVLHTDPSLFTKIKALGDENCMFAYRMVLVLMRRELQLCDVLTLWDIAWAYSGDDTSRNSETMHTLRTISLKKADNRSSKSIALSATLESLDRLMKGMPQDAGMTAGNERDHRKDAKCTSSCNPGFILHFIAAVIKSQRHEIIKDCTRSDDLMRLFNKPCIDFWETIGRARKQYKAYKQGFQVIQSLSGEDIFF